MTLSKRSGPKKILLPRDQFGPTRTQLSTLETTTELLWLQSPRVGASLLRQFALDRDGDPRILGEMTPLRDEDGKVK